MIGREHNSESPAPSEPSVLASGRFLQLLRADGWEYVERIRSRGAVLVVAVTDDGKLLLTEQFRIPVRARVIDLPAGLVGDEDGNESLFEAARRELEEETGYSAEKFETLAAGPSSAGLASEMVTFVRAGRLTRIGPGGGVGHEAITVHEVPLADLDGWLAEQRNRGCLIDVKLFAGLYLHRHVPGSHG